MATSGTYAWTRTRDQICYRAFRLITRTETDPDTTQLAYLTEALNGMVKEWQNDAVFMWETDWRTYNFSAPTQKTGTDGSFYTCIRSHTSDEAKRPVTGADWSSYWRLRGSTGGGWSLGQSYSSINEVAFPAEVSDVEVAFIRENNTDFPLELISMEDYFDVADKSLVARPTQMALDRDRSSVRGFLNYHLFTDTYDDYVLHYHAVRLLQDFNASADNPDAPVKALNAMTWGLAAEVGLEFGAPLDLMTFITAKSQLFYSRLKKGDRVAVSSEFVAPYA